MRYRRGSKVEVLNQKDGPSGSWRTGEILCGNGHTYIVRYDMHMENADEAVVEKAPRKVIRPCPPLLEVSDDWAPGDIVEVFDNFRWKIATVSEVIGRECLLVRLLGTLQEFRVNKNCLRLRLSWQDDNWFVIGKKSWSKEDNKQSKDSALQSRQQFFSSQVQLDPVRMKHQMKDGGAAYKNNLHAQEGFGAANQKVRLGKRKCRGNTMIATNSDMQPEAEIIASTQETLLVKHTRVPFDSTYKCSEMNVKRLKLYRGVRSSPATSLDSSRVDVTSSAGSCSISNNHSHELHCQNSAGPKDDGNLSDAESFCQWGNEELSVPVKEEVRAEVHSLELQAYRRTMDALYALGPLSWGGETLLTNLRLSLHISNDEHLLELKSLTSADTSTSFR